MGYKLTLIEYDEDIFDGDDMVPNISYRDYVTGVIGQREITEADQEEVNLIEIETRIEDMRAYAKVISSSSSSSSSSSLSSSSSSSSEAGGYKFKNLGVNYVANGLYISPDGYHLLTIDYGYGNQYYIKSYSFSTAWDITSLSFEAEIGVISDIGGAGMPCSYYHGIYAHPDGYHIYVLGSLDGYGCWVYDISIDTAWDITDNPTRVDDKYLNVYRWWYHRSLKFSSDGKKIYIAEEWADRVLQYNLSTAWDVSSSVTNPSQYTDIVSYDNQPKGVCFKSDGTKMMVMGGQYDTVLYWTLTSAWNLSGETKDENEEDISEHVSAPNDIFTNSAGDHVFVVESNGYLWDFDFS